MAIQPRVRRCQAPSSWRHSKSDPRELVRSDWVAAGDASSPEEHQELEALPENFSQGTSTTVFPE
jgi:hypothetical protein